MDTIPVPTGTDADLSDDLRREVRALARTYQPHSDPAVQRQAVGWARRAEKRAGRWLGLFLAGTVLSLAAALLPDIVRNR